MGLALCSLIKTRKMFKIAVLLSVCFAQGLPHSHRERTTTQRDTKVFLLPEKPRLHLGPVLKAAKDLGIQELNAENVPVNPQSWEAARLTKEFDLVWSYNYTKMEMFGQLLPHQKINHLPGSYVLVSKGLVYMTQMKLQKLYGKDDFNFIPTQYRIPEDYKTFLEAFNVSQSQLKDQYERPEDPQYGRRWLFKNQNHRGVRFFTGLRDVEALMHKNSQSKVMVAQCIEPLLISGHKFDIGIYVAVVGIDPLRIYIYNNVLLRMCKLKYPHVLDNSAALESYVVNDYMPPWEIAALKHLYTEIPTSMNEGTNHFDVLKQYLASIGIDPNHFQDTMYGNVVKIIAGNRQHFMTSDARLRSKKFKDDKASSAFGNTFFEMWRFDFLVDDAGKPWLMEVNQSPNLVPKHFPSGTDAKMKHNIVHDLLQLIGVTSPAARRPYEYLSHHAQKTLSQCHEECRDRAAQAWDITCWLCPDWFLPSEASTLFQAATEYGRRGSFHLAFPSVTSTRLASFLDSGVTDHDKHFQEYLLSVALKENRTAAVVTVQCSDRELCYDQGDCVRGQCRCDMGFQGSLCDTRAISSRHAMPSTFAVRKEIAPTKNETIGKATQDTNVRHVHFDERLVPVARRWTPSESIVLPVNLRVINPLLHHHHHHQYNDATTIMLIHMNKPLLLVTIMGGGCVYLAWLWHTGHLCFTRKMTTAKDA
jgi:tubulin monoglycylase TTLL15